eukprot:2224415-Rhodomonas_salina.5
MAERKSLCAQVHTVDWEAYIASKEAHEEAKRMEQGVVPKLLAAAEVGDNQTLVKLVGDGADPDWGNKVGTTALHMAGGALMAFRVMPECCCLAAA